MIMKHTYRFLCEIPDFIWQFCWALIRSNDSTIASLLRRKMYGTVCTIDTDVFIKNKNNFTSGQGSCLYHSCYILNTNGKFVIGNNSHLGALCYVNVCYGSVTIGDDVAVGPGTKIFAYSNHYRRGGKVTDEKIIKEVIIGNNVLVGANCTILPGTIINDNIIIGAGSIVKGELETNSIYAGIPCKKIKSGWYE
jgi:acetyltransferase-like isoleucine patch superfamily enzyme